MYRDSGLRKTGAGFLHQNLQLFTNAQSGPGKNRRDHAFEHGRLRERLTAEIAASIQFFMRVSIILEAPVDR
jgi:hypothetical protein